MSPEQFRKRFPLQHNEIEAPARVVLFVPFDQKDAARELGARWNALHRHWYCTRRDIRFSPPLALWTREGWSRHATLESVRFWQAYDAKTVPAGWGEAS